MIEFIVLIIGHIIEDIGFWVMSAIAIVSNILLHYQVSYPTSIKG